MFHCCRLQLVVVFVGLVCVCVYIYVRSRARNTSVYYIQRVLCYNLEKFVSARPCIGSAVSRLALSQLRPAVSGGPVGFSSGSLSGRSRLFYVMHSPHSIDTCPTLRNEASGEENVRLGAVQYALYK